MFSPRIMVERLGTRLCYPFCVSSDTDGRTVRISACYFVCRSSIGHHWPPSRIAHRSYYFWYLVPTVVRHPVLVDLILSSWNCSNVIITSFYAFGVLSFYHTRALNLNVIQMDAYQTCVYVYYSGVVIRHTSRYISSSLCLCRRQIMYCCD